MQPPTSSPRRPTTEMQQLLDADDEHHHQQQQRQQLHVVHDEHQHEHHPGWHNRSSSTVSLRRAQAELANNVITQRQRRGYLLSGGESLSAAGATIPVSPVASLRSSQRHPENQNYGSLLTPDVLNESLNKSYAAADDDDELGVFRSSTSESNIYSEEPTFYAQPQPYYKKLSVHRFPNFLKQVPAIAVVCLLTFMSSVPFGVAYFPVGWSSSSSSSSDDNNSGTADDSLSAEAVDDERGAFPLPGKAALGIRMALFSTLTGQFAMTFTSKFKNCIVYQLVENVPFYHALAHIVIQEQGYGKDALSTLFFLFGLGSIMVGSVFFVLVGCIGGIGVFVMVTAIEVTNNSTVTYDWKGLVNFVENLNLFGVVLLLEAILRVLNVWLTTPNGDALYPLLSPIYFCSIVPVFYLILWVFGIDVNTARDMGYFLPDPMAASTTSSSLPSCETTCSPPSFSDRVFDGHLWDIFTILSWNAISWRAVFNSLGTLVALTAFSLIQVPIMIPAFAVSSNVDVDMNAELVAHGASNTLAGFFGGLQNVLTYSISVLYHKSGGYGKASSLVIVALTGVLFVVGPAIAPFLPRAMAGTLLFHCGIDLFLEGIYDSYGVYDALEYSGIWFITIVMTTMGMTAALIAGVISALSTFAMQSITHLDPVFKIMPATTLRSSAWGRAPGANFILEHEHTGRARVLVVQLQGHLFFGNVASLTDSIKHTLNKKKGTEEEPLIVILDFTLVVGLDSSAAMAVAKLRGIMHRLFRVEVTVFVTGSHRGSFPCDYALTEALSKTEDDNTTIDWEKVSGASTTAGQLRRPERQPSITSVTQGSKSMKASIAMKSYPKNRVCDSLDEALLFAEEILIARIKPELLEKERQNLYESDDEEDREMSVTEELRLASHYLEKLAPSDDDLDVRSSIQLILSKCSREIYQESDCIWRQGDESHSAKLLIRGKLKALLEGMDGVNEYVHRGSLFGELGLIEGTKRLTTLTVVSKHAVTYSLDREKWEEVVEKHPRAARLLDRITIRYLMMRVQHVSNRIFETRCLPI